MRCEKCPAHIQTSDSYETPEYTCQLGRIDEFGETFKDGSDGCRLSLQNINKQIRRIGEYYDKMKASW